MFKTGDLVETTASVINRNIGDYGNIWVEYRPGLRGRIVGFNPDWSVLLIDYKKGETAIVGVNEIKLVEVEVAA